MGLLDDAIREHLELKRLSGADPADVDRLEREAFGAREQSVHAENPAGGDDEVAADAEEAHEHDAEAPLPVDARPPEQPTVQFTVEELEDAQRREDARPAPSRRERVAPEGHAQHEPEPVSDEEEFEEPEPEPGPDREPDPLPQAVRERAPALEPDDEPVHDELEETPEFLQETPEHDRLWFEQKPPKDFDF